MAVAEQILSRFPRHLDVDAPGKVVGELTRSLATGLEAQLADVGRIRRAHRVLDVEQTIDLVRLGGLAGVDGTFLGPLGRRLRMLADPASDAETLLDQLGLDDARDSLLAPWPGEADDAAARERLASAVRSVVSYDGGLAVLRQGLVATCALLLDRSGTVGGLLGATAAVLGLEVIELAHDDEGYWHLARCRDRLAIELANPPGSVPAGARRAGEHLLALEENPPHLADSGPVPRRHGDRFTVTRLGFEEVPCTVIVAGTGDRTVHPMVVNLDAGEGVATIVDVPDGAKLRFERDGRVELDGVSVARRAFRFHGAVFGEGGHPLDFVYADADDPPLFGDRAGAFAVTTPVDDAFGPEPSLPHTDGLLAPLRLARTGARFAVFAGVGTYGLDRGEGGIVLTAPEPLAGVFDESVFEPDPAGEPAFQIGLEWDERETYAVRVWLPRAFGALDGDGEPSVRELVRLQLDRHRAAGVHVYVDVTDPRWVLGTGILRDLESDAALGVAVAGTEAWEDDAGQPSDPFGPAPVP